jgi:SAM-dependent methyltransferase
MLGAPVDSSREPPANTLGDDEILQWALAYVRHAPVSLVLREINRLIALRSVEASRGPVLDVGCGDGFWWTVRPDDREVYGVDISTREVEQAGRRIHAARVDVSREVPFPGMKFEQVIANCSLEHVRDIDSALANLRRAASDTAQLVMFVPTPDWALHGKAQGFLLKHAPRVAMALAGGLNGFFQHWHLYDERVWRRLLEQHGWRIERTEGLGSARTDLMFRLFLPPAFVSFMVKTVTGYYPARIARFLPDEVVAPLARLVRWAVADPLVPADSPNAYEYMIVAHAAEIPPR